MRGCGLSRCKACNCMGNKWAKPKYIYWHVRSCFTSTKVHILTREETNERSLYFDFHQNSCLAYFFYWIKSKKKYKMRNKWASHIYIYILYIINIYQAKDRMLTYADVCMLTYVCWRMLTSADACRWRRRISMGARQAAGEKKTWHLKSHLLRLLLQGRTERGGQANSAAPLVSVYVLLY
jgi:hypothetical protein